MTRDEKLVAAHRYLYYVLNCPVISDYEYDVMERALPEDSIVRLTVGSEAEEDYAEDIKALTQQLLSS